MYIIFDYGHIVLKYTAHIVYSPLNSYLCVHWILDFKQLLLLLLLYPNTSSVDCTQYGLYTSKQYDHNQILNDLIQD